MNGQYQHVTPNPRVALVFWGDFYRDHPDAIKKAEALVSKIVTGRFMNGLVQYGVGRGTLLRPSLKPQDPAPDSIDSDSIMKRLKSWIAAPMGWPKPAVNEDNLVYLIYPPTGTKLEHESKDEKGNIIIKPNSGGYHASAKLNPSSNGNDLFWGIVNTTTDFTPHKSSGQELVGAVADTTSHELVEAFTDRDGKGFRPIKTSSHSEIADPCRKQTYAYGEWQVERYWSVWQKECIQGDGDVSLRQFLSSIAFDTDHRQLRSLGTSAINLEYLASKMRSVAPDSMC